jgi:hypothetical protein
MISEPEQEYGWFYFNPNMDGSVRVLQSDHGLDNIRVPWHVAPLAASDDSLSKSTLHLGDGSDTMQLVSGPAAGTDAADLYLLGATDPANSLGEEDIVAVGARSFTGADVTDNDASVPGGTDPLVGSKWRQFLTNGDVPRETVEFGVQTAGIHNTTETEEVDVLVDTGADGVFADPELQADYMVVKLPGPANGDVCVYDLSLADPFANCTALYFADYNNYNGNLFGLAVDARDLGLTNGDATLSYQVEACTGTFSGDVPGQICDTAGGFDDVAGTYTAKLNATDPARGIDPLVCGGFWAGGSCTGAHAIEVTSGSAAPHENPSILALFPNNAPSRTPTIVTTHK